jgi:8-oxo-dGTP pyrophosphatase MutT (NUDIX family)
LNIPLKGSEEMAAVECTIVESVVFRRSEGGPLYLILQRSPSEELYPGTWQIVTGIIEAGETAVSAALRELQEETSLRLTRFWVVPLLGSFFDAAHDSVQLCPLFAAEVDPAAEPRLSPEHQKYEWMEVEDALKYLVWPGHHKAVETVHQFIVGGRQAARLTEIDHTKAERKSP